MRDTTHTTTPREGRRASTFRWGVGLLVLLAGAGVARAGVVVLEDGQVFVGRMEDQDSSGVTLRWPYPGALRERGEMRFEAHRIRWQDAKADALTDAYFERFGDAPLPEPRWERARQEWLLRRREPETPEGPIVIPETIDLGPALHPDPVGGEGFSLLRPRGWAVAKEQGLTLIEAPSPAATGFKARIHVFSVRAASAVPAEQLAWIRGELAQVSSGFRVLEEGVLREGPDGAEQVLVTESVSSGRVVRALRKVCFRDARTYVFSAFADERDFPALRRLFDDCLRSMRVE